MYTKMRQKSMRSNSPHSPLDIFKKTDFCYSNHGALTADMSTAKSNQGNNDFEEKLSTGARAAVTGNGSLVKTIG